MPPPAEAAAEAEVEATRSARQGRPWQNGFVESFNGRLRDECLNREWFRDAREARVVIERWRQFYNTRRPHSSLDYRTPAQARLDWMTMPKIDEGLTVKLA